MKLPRKLSAQELIKRLRGIGYEPKRQTGSHVLTCTCAHGEHPVTIPMHDPLKIGTQSAILNDIAEARHATKEALLQELTD